MAIKNTTEEKNAVKEYFKGIKAEWGKISWPQKPQIVSEVMIVVAVVIFFTILVWLMDLIFSGALNLLNK